MMIRGDKKMSVDVKMMEKMRMLLDTQQAEIRSRVTRSACVSQDEMDSGQMGHGGRKTSIAGR